MFGRRGVLRMLARAAVTGALGPVRLFGVEVGRQAAGPPRGFGAELQEQVTALGRRVYSEQGIPMVLACEDLVGDERATRAAGAMNVEFGAVFDRCAETWERLHAGAPAGDVASLVELLAVRDFASGGRSAE